MGHARRLILVLTTGVLLILAQANMGRAQAFELINSFAGCPVEGCGPGVGDGATPFVDSPLVLGPDGNFYGVAGLDWRPGEETARSWGTIFRVSTNGMRTVLHSFDGIGPGGCGPSTVTFGADGALYGAAVACWGEGSSVIFRLAGTSYQVLEEFPQGGFRPTFLTTGADGSIYGCGGAPGSGRFFKWNGTLTILPGSSGCPSNMRLAPDGNFYWAQAFHLPFDVHWGAVMRINPADGLAVQAHTFPSEDSIVPESNVILGQDGALYGTSTRFGIGGPTRLYRMPLYGALTYLPYSEFGYANPLLACVDGSIYVVKSVLGASHPGIARLMPDGTLVPVHVFGGVDGSGGISPLTRGPDGHFYGMTREGGEHGFGVFFRLRMPIADIKANGADGPIAVGPGDPLQIAMAFDASATEVVNPSEAYLAVVTPALQILWATSSGFSLTPAPLYTGPLPSFPSTQLINIPDAAVLPTGDYYWVAIVDADSNGVPNGHYVDFVKTTKTAPSLATVRRR